MSQSRLCELPRPGTRNPTIGDTYSTAMASVHSTTRASWLDSAPAIQSTLDTASHTATRWKLRRSSGRVEGTAHPMNSVRPSCIAT